VKQRRLEIGDNGFVTKTIIALRWYVNYCYQHWWISNRIEWFIWLLICAMWYFFILDAPVENSKVRQSNGIVVLSLRGAASEDTSLWQNCDIDVFSCFRLAPLEEKKREIIDFCVFVFSLQSKTWKLNKVVTLSYCRVFLDLEVFLNLAYFVVPYICI
jgi:hypothetical protein